MRDDRLKNPDPIRVLLVEDNPADQLLVRSALRSLDVPDVSVGCAASLEEALRALKVETIDVVLLDLNLTDSWGLDTLRAVVKHSPNVPVVVLTGLADEQFAIKSLKKGAQDYLVKGEWTDSLLIRTLRHARERQRLMVANRNRSFSLDETVVFDEVTGLYNVATFEVAAGLHLRMAQQRSVGAALLLARLLSDGPDSCSVPVAVLERTATLMLDSFRVADIIGHIADCEFALLAIGGTPTFRQSRKVMHFQDKLMEFLEGREQRDVMLHIGVSVHQSGDPATTLESMLTSARTNATLA